MLFVLYFFSFSLSAQISIVSYNVQNLNHSQCPEQKIPQLQKALKALDYPDFLALLEVENLALIRKVAGPKYRYLLSSDSPPRKMAFLYRRGTLISSRRHEIKGSREIWEVRILLSGKRFVFFINHWPSQRNPRERRELAGEVLLKRLKEVEEENIIVLGDFNLDPRWEKNNFFSQTSLIDLFSANQGTYFFTPYRKWLAFDRFFIGPKLLPLVKMAKVGHLDFLTLPFWLGGKLIRVPRKFVCDVEVQGFSDHFPVLLILSLGDGQKS